MTIEALLRPPVELTSTATSASAAVLAAVGHELVLMPPEVGWGACAAFLALSAHRGRQAWRVLRYQRGLKRRNWYYTVPPRRIPGSAERLSLGRGFRWTATHTQRLRDTLLPKAARYVPPGRSHVHGVEPREGDVLLDMAERVGHVLVLGATRVGKTRLAELLIAQDCRRPDTAVVVIDPKGDADLLRRCATEARRNGRAFHVLHLGHPEKSERYNPLGAWRRLTEVATRLVSTLPDSGDSAAFRNFAWLFSNVISRALEALGRVPTFADYRRYIADPDGLLLAYAKPYLDEHAPGWRAEVRKIAAKLEERKPPPLNTYITALASYIEGQPLDDRLLADLVDLVRYDRSYYLKLSATLLPLLEKLLTGPVAEILTDAGEDARPVFTWEQVIRERGVVFVGLDALGDHEVAAAVGSAMLSDLATTAAAIYKGQIEGAGRVALHLDELSEIVNAETIQLANKAGGAKFELVAYSQTIADLEAGLGSQARAKQLRGNFNTVILLRVKEAETAEVLTGQLPRVQVHQLTTVTGATDNSTPGDGVDFTSGAQDRLSTVEAPLIEAADLVALPKGQAFALLPSGELWKLRIPTLEDPEPLPVMVEALAEDMRAEYATGAYWWRAQA